MTTTKFIALKAPLVQPKKRDIILDRKSISNYGILIKKFYEIYKKPWRRAFRPSPCQKIIKKRLFYVAILTTALVKKEVKPNKTENYLPLVRADISNFTICSLGSL